MTPQELVAELQKVLGLRVTTGQITLNINEGRFASFESRTYGKVRPEEDRRSGLDERRTSAHT